MLIFFRLCLKTLLPIDLYLWLVHQKSQWRKARIHRLTRTLQGIAPGQFVSRTKYEAQTERTQEVEHRCLMSEVILALSEIKHEALMRQIRRLQIEKKELEAIATTDPLTGVNNRRGLETRFTAEIGALRRQTPGHDILIAGVLIDLDNFKKINDSLGHPKGDLVLKKTGELLQNIARRPEDIASRYGGEEFLVILLQARIDDAYRQATNFASTLRATPVLEDRIVTASIGVAELSLDPITSPRDALLRLYHMADKAMYEAKRRGRDRVIVYTKEALDHLG